MIERRKSKRMDISVSIKLKTIQEKSVSADINDNEFEVHVINISKDGIAFKSAEKMELNTFYDTTIELWDKETFDAVIEIIRMENLGVPETTYGCRFIGINAIKQYLIDVHQIIEENANQTQELRE